MPAVWPEMSVCPGASAVFEPRFQVMTFVPAVSTDSTLGEVAAGQSTVPFDASSVNVYSPRSSSEHVQTKFVPAPPAGTPALAGAGPPQVALPLGASVPGLTAACAVELLTFSVTVTVFGCWSTFVDTAIAVLRTGGPGSLPGTAAIGVYAPYAPPWPVAAGGAVAPAGTVSKTRRFVYGVLSADAGVSV